MFYLGDEKITLQMLHAKLKMLNEENSEVVFFAGYWIILLSDYVREEYGVHKSED
jgi:hypothetical protein